MGRRSEVNRRGSTRARWWRPLAWIGGALSLAELGVGLFLRRRLGRPYPREPRSWHPFDLGLPWEDVRFPTAGGLTLHGWWIPRPGRPGVVVAPGHRSPKPWLLGIAGHLWRAGFQVFLFDYRARGESEGDRITLGNWEIYDLMAALDVALERLEGAPLGLLGYSMGGALAIVAAARRPEVAAVVADSPFADQKGVIEAGFRRTFRLPAAPFLPVAERFLGVRLDRIRPLEVVDRIAPRPLLLIHGTADEMVPVEHSRRLYARAGEPKAYWELEGVLHVGAYFHDRPGYVRRVVGFFARALGLPEEAAVEAALDRPVEVGP